MTDPWATVVLVDGTRRVELGPVDGNGRCDVGLVDDLLRLRLAAMRLGWSIELVDVAPRLRELLDLVGSGFEEGRQPEPGEEIV